MRMAYDRKHNSSDGILYAAVKAVIRLSCYQKTGSQIWGGGYREFKGRYEGYSEYQQ